MDKIMGKIQCHCQWREKPFYEKNNLFCSNWFKAKQYFVCRDDICYLEKEGFIEKGSIMIIG